MPRGSGNTYGVILNSLDYTLTIQPGPQVYVPAIFLRLSRCTHPLTERISGARRRSVGSYSSFTQTALSTVCSSGKLVVHAARCPGSLARVLVIRDLSLFHTGCPGASSAGSQAIDLAPESNINRRARPRAAAFGGRRISSWDAGRTSNGRADDGVRKHAVKSAVLDGFVIFPASGPRCRRWAHLNYNV